MLKIKIKNCCCCCNSGSGGEDSGGGGDGGGTTTKYTVTIGAPIDENNNIIQNPTILVNGSEKQVGDRIEVDPNTVITIKVTADGYEDFEQEYTITEPQTITPVLTATGTEPVYYTITVNVISPSSGTTTKIDGVVQSQKTVLAGTNHTILVTSSEIYYGSHYETINNIQHDETINVRLPITVDAKRDHDPNFHLYFGVTGESSWEYDPINEEYTIGDSARSGYISDAEGQSTTFNVFSYFENSGNKDRVDINYSITNDGSDYLDIDVQEDVIGNPGSPAFVFTITKKANAPAISSDKSFMIIIQQDNTDYSDGTYGKGDGKRIKCIFELRHA